VIGAGFSVMAGVSTTAVDGRTMTPAEWSRLAADKVIGISETAPPAIRDQAVAFKEQVRAVLERYISMAVEERRAADAAIAEAAGQSPVAEAIRRG
jgi:hypothetical protein